MTVDLTIPNYRKNARQAIENWAKSRRKKKIPPFFRCVQRYSNHLKCSGNGIVLDLGCGPGFDLIEFARKGWNVHGMDAVPEFLSYARTQIRHYNMERRTQLIRGDFRKPSVVASLPNRRYAVVWANASLIHIRKKFLPAILRKLVGKVCDGGILAATFFHGKGESVYQGSFVPGRFFARYLKDELRRCFERGGWEIEMLRTVSNEDRKGKWLNVIARPAQGGGG